jgi:hypothetical protein
MCIAMLAFAGCTYEDQQAEPGSTVALTQRPTASPLFTLPEPLVVRAPLASGGIHPSVTLPREGECSFNRARQFPIGDIRYLGPTYAVPDLNASAWNLHGEGGMLAVSWPQETYLDLKRVTPSVESAPVKIFEISKESFESLMQANPSLDALVKGIGGLPLSDAFFVTSYDCIPYGGIK